MKLVELHREFINRSTRPLISSGLPIKVANLDKPIIAVEKWKVTEGKLNKKFMFESFEDRNRFLKSMFEYETQVGHHAGFKVEDLEVTISLITKDVDKVTELDKEYAKYADVVRRDLVYNPKDE
jgi:pterin-4a-carbinolamine dehydratase